MKDILILEDGLQERERLEKLFKNAGYTVEACGSVGEAEGVVQKELFRLAILDIGLGDKSGSYFFNTLKYSGKSPLIVILTGNPSVHLKQRLLQEGAVDYIIKASAQAQNDALLARVKEILGEPQKNVHRGVALDVFLAEYVSHKCHSLFYEVSDKCNNEGKDKVSASETTKVFATCRHCGSEEYLVEFESQTQVPPDIRGRVVCAVCGKVMDPQVE